MKLVKITEPREGFVYEGSCNKMILTGIKNGSYTFTNYDEEGNETYESEANYFFESIKLIGKIGITHKIENEKLIEIPRDDVEVDDVFESDALIVVVSTGLWKDGRLDFEYITPYKDTWVRSNRTFSDVDWKHKGILGIHYKFVNSKES